MAAGGGVSQLARQVMLACAAVALVAGCSSSPYRPALRSMVRGGLLNADLQARRIASVRPIDPDNPGSAGYGWALAKFGPLYGHTGELPGYNSFMGHDPANDVTLVIWTNLAPSVEGLDPATTIARALIGMIYAPPR